MKKIQKAIWLYCSVFLFSIIIHSCCDSSGIRIIGGGTIVAVDLINFTEITEVTGPFRFETNLETETAYIENLSLINSAMAFSCDDFFFTNSLIAEEFKISCDKDFNFKGTTIQANSDFSQLSELDYQLHDGAIEVNFTNLFMENVEFKEEDYTFKITNKTTDEIDLESEITLSMKL